MQIPQEKLQRVVCQVGKAKRRANESSLARLVPLHTFKGCGNTSELRWYSDKQFALFGVDCIFFAMHFAKTPTPWCKNCCCLCRSGAKLCKQCAVQILCKTWRKALCKTTVSKSIETRKCLFENLQKRTPWCKNATPWWQNKQQKHN